jgi:hypothetical protein
MSGHTVKQSPQIKHTHLLLLFWKRYTPIEVRGWSSKKNQQQIRNNVISREEHPLLLVASHYKK